MSSTFVKGGEQKLGSNHRSPALLISASLLVRPSVPSKLSSDFSNYSCQKRINLLSMRHEITLQNPLLVLLQQLSVKHAGFNTKQILQVQEQ